MDIEKVLSFSSAVFEFHAGFHIWTNLDFRIQCKLKIHFPLLSFSTSSNRFDRPIRLRDRLSATRCNDTTAPPPSRRNPEFTVELDRNTMANSFPYPVMNSAPHATPPPLLSRRSVQSTSSPLNPRNSSNGDTSRDGSLGSTESQNSSLKRSSLLGGMKYGSTYLNSKGLDPAAFGQSRGYSRCWNNYEY